MSLKQDMSCEKCGSLPYPGLALNQLSVQGETIPVGEFLGRNLG